MLFQLIYDSIGFDKKMIVGRFVVLCAPVLSKNRTSQKSSAGSMIFMNGATWARKPT